MSTFNINRFAQALKCQFLVMRKMWIRLFGIFTLVMFMAGLFWTRVQGTGYDYMVENWPAEDVYRNYNHYVEQTLVFSVIFFCFSMLFGASYLFSSMKETRKRSAFLLWPVSNLEKYVVNLLLSILWLAIITVGACLLADTLRVFVDWVTGRIVIWGFPKLAEPFGNNAAFEHWQTAWMFFTWVFYIHSLYIVGGTLFRRQQFLLIPADQLHDSSCRHLADNASKPDRLEQHEHRVHHGHLGREDRNLYAYFPSLLLYSEHSSDPAHLRPLLGIV